MRLDQSAGADIKRRFERSSCRSDVARDQQNARDAGFAARTGQEIVEGFLRLQFTRRDMQHRIEAALRSIAAVSRCSDNCRSQECDSDVVPGTKLLRNSVS